MKNFFNTKIERWYTKDKNFSRLTILFLVLLLSLTLIKPDKFLSIENFQSMIYQFPEFGLMSIGVMLTMITGGIDLSVVGMANLTSIITASAMVAILPENATNIETVFSILIAVVLGLVCSALCGYFNGTIVSRLNIPPILATLGSQQLFTGVGLVITKGSSVGRLPSMYSEAGRTLVLGLIPLAFFIFIGAVFCVSILLNKTAFGVSLYMMGSNAKASHFSGLNNTKITNRAFMYSGILSGIAGLIMLANYNSAKPDYGSAYTLQCILIVVLGGVNPNGGFGKIGGVTMAIFILQILSSGLNLFPNISNFYRPLIWGGVLLLILSLNYFSEQRELKRIANQSK